jgi:uncharacterized Tic20 family protein
MNAESAGTATLTQDERVTAALAHATVILPMMGVLGAIVIWATQKDKSPYAAFQALQATVYHIVMILAGFLAGICYMCSIFVFPLGLPLSMAAVDPAGGEASPLLALAFFLFMMFPLVVMCAAGFLWLGYIGYGLFGAASALGGKDFRYVVIGRRLERYLAASKP